MKNSVLKEQIIKAAALLAVVTLAIAAAAFAAAFYRYENIDSSSEQIDSDSYQTASYGGKTPTLIVFEPEMVLVEGGTFNMGNKDFPSPHKVTLSSFSIGKYEVTQEQWEAIMGYNYSRFKDCKNCPVENVSWDEAQKFILKLNDATGKKYRLPTEAEWEYAARGGNKSKGYLFSGSNTLDDVAWYEENNGKKTHPVGTKTPNELGIHDMSGNVWEWCSDWYGDYSSLPQTNPKGPSYPRRPDYPERVVRGNTVYPPGIIWTKQDIVGHVAYREAFVHTYQYGGGFRLVLPVKLTQNQRAQK
jgi:formylglycine-generating enzyme required for sulfatase activity